MLTWRFRKIRNFHMALLIILGCVFAGVALMVVFGEKFGTPMTQEQQSKFAKITRILVFVLIITAIIRLLMTT